MQNGDTIYLDGVRFHANDLNPQKLPDGTYQFKGLFNLPYRFEQPAFDVVFRGLDIVQKPAVYSTIGTIDSIFNSNDGKQSSLYIDSVAYSTVYSLRLYGDVYNCMIRGSRYYSNMQYTQFHNCVLHNISTSYSLFDNCKYINPYYAIYHAYPNEFINTVIDFSLSSYPIYIGGITQYLEYKNIKIRSEKSWLFLIRSYYSDIPTFRFINFDISECGDNPYARLEPTGGLYLPNIDFEFTFKLNTYDGITLEPLEGVIVTIRDKGNNVIGVYYTDENGEIGETTIVYYRLAYGQISQTTYAYFDTGEGFQSYFPFTVEISKEGYQTQKVRLLEQYSRDDKVVRQGYNSAICMNRESLCIKKITTKDCETAENNDGQITIDTLEGGYPPYQYSIDGISYQDSNIFSGLNPGIYTIYVRDSYNHIEKLEGIIIRGYEEAKIITKIEAAINKQYNITGNINKKRSVTGKISKT